MTREQPQDRRHETYEQKHWETAHVERVDKVFATGSRSDSAEFRIRIDMDGFGHGGASLHDVGENIQTSLFMSPDKARELRDYLDEALENAETKPICPECSRRLKDASGEKGWWCPDCHVVWPIGEVSYQAEDFK